MQRSDFKCKRGMLESTAKKIKSGENVMVPVPDLDRAIDAQSLHAAILEEYVNGQFKLRTRYILILV